METSDDTLPPGGQMLRQAFEALVTTLDELGIRFAVIGGLALLQHTRIRTTDDIDVLLAVPQIGLPGLFDALRRRGFSAELEKSVREFLDDGLTTVQFEGVLVDLMRPILPAYAHILDRAIATEILGRKVRVSSAEGLVVMKLIALRPQDEADIQELIAAYGRGLDLEFIRRELETLTTPDDPRRGKLEAWIRQAAAEP